MAIPLFNMLNGAINNSPMGVILSQMNQLQNNPGKIIDILLDKGKITQQQYQELQPYKNNPQQIYNYLMNHGNAAQLNNAMNMVQKPRM